MQEEEFSGDQLIADQVEVSSKTVEQSKFKELSDNLINEMKGLQTSFVAHKDKITYQRILDQKNLLEADLEHATRVMANDLKKLETDSKTKDEILADRINRHKIQLTERIAQAVNFEPVINKVKSYLNNCSLTAIEFAKLIEPAGFQKENLNLGKMQSSLVNLRILTLDESINFLEMLKFGYTDAINVHSFCKFLDSNYTKQQLSAVKNEEDIFRQIRERQFEGRIVDGKTKVAF